MQTRNLRETNLFYGDDTGEYNRYIHHAGEQVVISDSIADLLSYIKKQGHKISVSNRSVAYLLRNSLVTYPNTAYDSIYVMGIGDRLAFDKKNCGLTPQLSSDFPYFQDQSLANQIPSSKKLHDLLCDSVGRKVTGDACLMLSSGKDSVAIAMAIQECGLQDRVQAFTYRDIGHKDADESSQATAIAGRLGIAHKTLRLPEDTKLVSLAMRHYFTHSPYPSCDPTTVPYFLLLYSEGLDSIDILDGTRNDAYMAIIPSTTYGMLWHYYRLVHFVSGTIRGLGRMVPFYSKAIKFFSSCPEVNLYRHGHLPVERSRKFFLNDVDVSKFWKETYERTKTLSLVDFHTFIIGQYYDGCGVTIKARSVAASLNSRVVLPWADRGIIDYYFNLPEDSRFDLKRRRNKVLLRETLAEYLDYDSDAVGKKVFYFNSQNFIMKNVALVREEILQCGLWEESIGGELSRDLEILERNPRVAGAVMDLFMISGWYNHCKFLNPP